MDLFYSQRKSDILPVMEPINPEVVNFDTFIYYPIEDFTEIDDLTYELNINTLSGTLGIDYTSVPGENHMLIYADGKSVCDRHIIWENGFQMRIIEKAVDRCEINSNIRIEFSSEEQANNFHGLIIHNYS